MPAPEQIRGSSKHDDCAYLKVQPIRTHQTVHFGRHSCAFTYVVRSASATPEVLKAVNEVMQFDWRIDISRISLRQEINGDLAPPIGSGSFGVVSFPQIPTSGLSSSHTVLCL